MGARMYEYYSALEDMIRIRKTNISKENLRLYYDAGERCIAALEGAFDEMKAEDELYGRKFDPPPSIPAPVALPDMYMRYGRWEDALRVYRFCRPIPYLDEFDFDALESDALEKQSCVRAVAQILSRGVHSQKRIKLSIGGPFSANAINWTLRFYRGFYRTKQQSDFFVDFVPGGVLTWNLHGVEPVELM